MANNRNGYVLRAKDVDVASNGAIDIQQVNGLGITLGVMIDNSTITITDSGSLQVGTIAISNVSQLQSTITTINNRIDSLESGSVDLSNYMSNTGKLSILTKEGEGAYRAYGFRAEAAFNEVLFGLFDPSDPAFNGITTIRVKDGSIEFLQNTSQYFVASTTALTWNGHNILTDNNKDVNGGVLGINSSGKVTATFIPIGNGLEVSSNLIAAKGGTGITVNASGINVAAATASTLGGVTVADSSTSYLVLESTGALSVNAASFILATEKGATNGVAPLANGKIPVQYIDTISFKEIYSATASTDGTITLAAGQNKTEASQLELGDEIILTASVTWNGNTYPDGSIFVRNKVSEGATKDTLADYAYESTNMLPATTAEVNAGTVNNKYVSPVSLKGSAPEILGTNITGIPGTAVSVADGTNLGVVKVTAGNGLTIAGGTVSMALASGSTGGAVIVGTNITLTDGTISIPDASSSEKGVVQIGTTSGQVPVIQSTNKLQSSIIPLATSVNVGGVIIPTNGGLTVDGTGNLSVNVDGTTIGKAANGALQVIASGIPDPIALSASNYDADAGTVTITAITPPKAIIKKSAPYSYRQIIPDTATPAEGGYTFVLDVSGMTDLNTTDWEAIF